MRHQYRKAERPQLQAVSLNPQEEGTLLDWSERYGVPVERIQEAIHAVGNRVADVAKYLLDSPKGA